MTLMPTLPEVTDPERRAELARWAVSLRRAHAAGTGQVDGKLHYRWQVVDVDDQPIGTQNSFCCLGIWCVIQEAAGVLVSTTGDAWEYGTIAYADADADRRGGEGHGFANGALPAPALLAGAADPDLLRAVFAGEGGQLDLEEEAEISGYADADAFAEEEAATATAAELNDDHGLNFDQIADVVVWRYGLTPEELAEAEKAPRVPAVEGAEPEAA